MDKHIWLHAAADERRVSVHNVCARILQYHDNQRQRARVRDESRVHWSDSAAKEIRTARLSPEESRFVQRIVNDAQDLRRVNLTRLASAGSSYAQITANKELARRLKETDWNSTERKYRPRRI
jgi:hypothetical protein